MPSKKPPPSLTLEQELQIVGALDYLGQAQTDVLHALGQLAGIPGFARECVATARHVETLRDAQRIIARRKRKLAAAPATREDDDDAGDQLRRDRDFPFDNQN